MSLRQQDYQSENSVSTFLDRHFYPSHVSNFKRYTDQDYQFKGIDVSFDFESHVKMLVDEKAAAHYVNKNLPTFALELDYIGSDGELKPGWLFDSEKQTQYYLFSWIWANKERGFSVDDITKLEVALVKRNSILTFLTEHGMDSSKARDISSQVRQSGRSGRHDPLPFAPFKVYFTDFLSEKPINVIVRKSNLIRMSLLHKVVTA